MLAPARRNVPASNSTVPVAAAPPKLPVPVPAAARRINVPLDATTEPSLSSAAKIEAVLTPPDLPIAPVLWIVGVAPLRMFTATSAVKSHVPAFSTRRVPPRDVKPPCESVAPAATEVVPASDIEPPVHANVPPVRENVPLPPRTPALIAFAPETVTVDASAAFNVAPANFACPGNVAPASVYVPASNSTVPVAAA